MQEAIIVGVDVSKATLDYICLPGGKAKQVPNSATGFKKLIKEILGLQPKLTVLEATGGYQTDFVSAMHEALLPVKVVNPRQVRDFARSLNRLSKTDKLDARTIAEFGQSRELIPDRPHDPKLKEISYLLRRREHLVGMNTAEKSQLEHAHSKYRQKHINLMNVLAKEIKELDKEIKTLMETISELAKKNTIIQSIPGVGPVTAATLVAELPELSSLGRKQVCALVGLAPFNRDSGKFRGQRHIFAGRSRIRKVLYCALRPCLQFNPIIKAWFEHFINAGKAYKVAAVACIRKLLVVIRAMLKNEQNWDPKAYAIS